MAQAYKKLSDVLHQEVDLTAVCIAICTVSVALRLWTKLMILRKMQLDDWFLLAALVAYYILFALQRYLTYLVDQFVNQGKVPSIRKATAVLKTAVIMYPVAMALVKIAVSCILSRIFVAVPGIRITVWIIATFTVLSSVVTCLFVAITCGTVASLLPGFAHCHLLKAYNDVGTFFAGANTVTDLVLVVISVAAFWNLRMSKWKKVSTLLLLILGMTTWIVSLARLIWTYGIPESQWTPIHNTKSVFFSIVEIFSGITGTALSGIRPLARVWHKTIKDSLKGSYPTHSRLSTAHNRVPSESTEAVARRLDAEGSDQNIARTDEAYEMETQQIAPD